MANANLLEPNPHPKKKINNAIKAMRKLKGIEDPELPSLPSLLLLELVEVGWRVLLVSVWSAILMRSRGHGEEARTVSKYRVI